MIRRRWMAVASSGIGLQSLCGAPIWMGRLDARAGSFVLIAFGAKRTLRRGEAIAVVAPWVALGRGREAFGA